MTGQGLHFAFGVHPKLAHKVMTKEMSAQKGFILKEGRCQGISEIGIDLSGNFGLHLKDQLEVLRSFLEFYVSKQLWSMVIVIHIVAVGAILWMPVNSASGLWKRSYQVPIEGNIKCTGIVLLVV